MRYKLNQHQIKLLRYWAIGAACIIGFVMYLIFQAAERENQKLLAEGEQAEVVIVDKYNAGTRKFPRYEMKIAFFTAGDTIPLISQADTVGMSKAEKFAEDALQKVFGNKTRTRLGDYKSVSLNNVSPSSFHRLNVGDRATLVYLPNDLANAKFLAELE